MSPARRVRSGEVDLAVTTLGHEGAPVLLVHGYPDTSAVWRTVAERLAPRHRLALYDVRGAGASTAPASRDGYHLDRLIDDMAAVADSFSPDRPVHLVGHDWGSIQGWEAIVHERLAGRIASFTSISGPSLDHAGRWMRERIASGELGKVGEAANQLVHSWYIALFHLPVLAPLGWKSGFAGLWPSILRRVEGVDAEAASTLAEDGSRGVELYRANVIERLASPRTRRTDVPVLLVVATRDPFVNPGLLRGLERIAPRLERREIDAAHWVPLSHPEVLAGWIEEHVARVERDRESSEEAS